MAFDNFWGFSAKHPERLAVVEADGRTVTQAEMLAGVNQLSHGLQSLGLARGDSIAAMLPNSRAAIEVFLAMQQIGLYLTPINYHLVGPETLTTRFQTNAQAALVHGAATDRRHVVRDVRVALHDVRDVAILVTLWVATAVLYPKLRALAGWFVDTIVLDRPDYDALRVTIASHVQFHEDIPSMLDDACARLAPALSARGVRWLERHQDSGSGVLIHLPGGDLNLEWREADNCVYMTGPATEVFSGEWNQ